MSMKYDDNNNNNSCCSYYYYYYYYLQFSFNLPISGDESNFIGRSAKGLPKKNL